MTKVIRLSKYALARMVKSSLDFHRLERLGCLVESDTASTIKNALFHEDVMDARNSVNDFVNMSEAVHYNLVILSDSELELLGTVIEKEYES